MTTRDTHDQSDNETVPSSEERLKRVLDTEAVGVMFFNYSGTLIDANDAFLRMTGYTREQVTSGKLHWRDLTPPEYIAAGEEQMRRFEQTGRIGPYEKEYTLANGSRHWMHFTGRDLGDGTIAEYVIDLTEQKRAEEALRESEMRLRESEEQLRRLNEQLEERVVERTAALQAEVHERRAAEDRIKNLLRQLVSVQEQERRRIARELHDTLGQQLAALHMSIEVLKASADGETNGHEHIERMRETFDGLNSSVDFLAWELRPPSLDILGLDDAMANYVKGWSQQFGVEAVYEGVAVSGLRLAAEAETNLYRIFQEALQNVHKHSGADRVNVVFERRDGQAVLIIEDNGKGYDSEAQDDGRGMGLINMRERAALINGALEIESQSGAGTTVFVRVPVAENGHQ